MGSALAVYQLAMNAIDPDAAPTNLQKKENLRKGLLGNNKNDGEDEDSGISLSQILALKERFDNADQVGTGHT